MSKAEVLRRLAARTKSKNRVVGSTGMKAETRTARRVGAVQVLASGALPGKKGDMELKDFKIENKATVNASMSLKLDWLAKIAGEAKDQNKKPALAVQFVTKNGEPVRHGKWVMVPESVFEELLK